MSDDQPAVAPGRSLPRTEARQRALELLFAADVRGRSAADLVDDPVEGWVDDFTRTLVTTVIANLDDIDQVVEEFARGWTIDRMPHVDRSILRLALAEMLHLDEVPPKVAIDEAVELAKALSTDDSPKFINGVLAAVGRDRQLI